jgi:hypothetical protein
LFLPHVRCTPTRANELTLIYSKIISIIEFPM